MVQSTQTQQANRLAFYDRVWSDEAFAASLETNPKAALEEYFGPVKDDIEIEVVRDTSKKRYIHIPASPKEGEVSDYELMNVSGGLTLVDNSFGLTCPTAATMTVTVTLNPTFVPQ